MVSNYVFFKRYHLLFSSIEIILIDII